MWGCVTITRPIENGEESGWLLPLYSVDREEKAITSHRYCASTYLYALEFPMTGHLFFFSFF